MNVEKKALIEESFIKNTGALIKAARKKKGWSQENLASEIGVSVSVISDIENGKLDMPLSRLAVISDVLEMNSFLYKDDLLISEVLKALAKYGEPMYKEVIKPSDDHMASEILNSSSMNIFAVKHERPDYFGKLKEFRQPTREEDEKFERIINRQENSERKKTLLLLYEFISYNDWENDIDLQTMARACCRYAVSVSDDNVRAWMKDYYNKCRYGTAPKI